MSLISGSEDKQSVILFVDTIHRHGGVGKVVVEDANLLAQINQYEVSIMVLEAGVNRDSAYEIDSKVKVIFLSDFVPRILQIKKILFNMTVLSSRHFLYPMFLLFCKLPVRMGKISIIFHETYLFPSLLALRLRNKFSSIYYLWDTASYIIWKVYFGKFNNAKFKLFSRLAHLLDFFIFHSSEKILSSSPAHIANYPFDNSDVKMILPMVPERKLKNPINKSGVVLCTSWKKGKNYEAIFDICRRLPDIHVNMIGDWLDLAERIEFERKLCDFGLTNRISVLGAVSESRLYSMLSESLVLIQLSRDVGFGLPPLEAASLGTTSIIPSGQGVGTVLRNKLDIVEYEENDIDELSAKLQWLLDNPNHALALGVSAKKTVRNACNPSRRLEILREAVCHQ